MNPSDPQAPGKSNTTPVPETSAPEQPNPSWKSVVIENVVSISIALLLVFGIRSTLVEAFKIPSGSMIPTLLIGDHIFVNKMAYGLKVPFSDWIGDKPIYIVKRDGPKRGDIVVFVYPRDESLYYIKRVVGLPGDEVRTNGKEVSVNGKPVPKTEITGAEKADILTRLDADIYRDPILFNESLDETKHLMMLDQMMDPPFGEEEAVWKVPEGQYFVMGDNRDHSNDSRAWGFVPFDNIRGRAFVVWLSLQINWEEKAMTFRPERIWNALN
jgi:signal peptidase I